MQINKMMMCEYVRRDRVFVLRAPVVCFFSLSAVGMTGKDDICLVLDMVLSARAALNLNFTFFFGVGATKHKKIRKGEKSQRAHDKKERKKERDDYDHHRGRRS